MTTVGTSLYLMDVDEFMERNAIYRDAHLTHERVHAVSQGNSVLAWWILRYLVSNEFMLAEEKKACAAEIEFKVRNGAWYMWSAHFKAKTLSGPIYGNMISYGEALQWVTKTATAASH